MLVRIEKNAFQLVGIMSYRWLYIPFFISFTALEINKYFITNIY